MTVAFIDYVPVGLLSGQLQDISDSMDIGNIHTTHIFRILLLFTLPIERDSFDACVNQSKKFRVD